jgi:aconitase B
MRERMAVKKVVAEFIKKMTTKDAKHIGLSKRHLFRLKKKIKEGKKIVVLNRKTVNKLLRLVVF